MVVFNSRYGSMAPKTMKKWILTDTFDFYSKDANYWNFTDFDEAKRIGERLVSTIVIVYLWKGTNGSPIKWMKFD